MIKDFFMTLSLTKGWIEGVIVLIIMSFILIITGLINWGKPEIQLDFKISLKEKKLYGMMFVLYPLWGLVQQFAILFFYYFLCVVFPNSPYNLFIGASLFMLLHFPNIFLMFFAFGIELLFMNYYIRTGNIIMIAFIHGILGTILKTFYPKKISTSFNIFYAYWKEQKELINRKALK